MVFEENAVHVECAPAGLAVFFAKLVSDPLDQEGDGLVAVVWHRDNFDGTPGNDNVECVSHLERYEWR